MNITLLLRAGVLASVLCCQHVHALLITEIHADPAPAIAGDANGDGERHSYDDEFIELFNHSATAIDLSGWQLHDGNMLRHLFPQHTMLAAQQALVVFGGGLPSGSFGQSIIQTASSGSLRLNNSGDTIKLFDSDNLLQVIASYGNEGGNDQSLTRLINDLNAPLSPHLSFSGMAYSPGLNADGTPFLVSSSQQTASPIPEPSTLLMFASLLALLAAYRQAQPAN
ncbi:lamin tail domain-containing protein [Neiella sp. HB171785]|uniref:Lamin tail domain-containing protein n=1 Tax=Neiella litorisoli TaxID=2771431 RepID=A0A8J6UPI0_9GAMM|nr:lamin tail domain-containing protein [Neiella litorisoli]MBD1388472.1 lamin tail domain-containing protein [Neiella litorisoli]